MVTITFTASGGAVSIDGQVVYSSKFADERYSQTSQTTGDGALVVYDVGGVDVVFGEIIIKAVSYADGELLRTWIRTKAIYMLNSFSVTTPAGVDLGNGKGVALANVNFMQKNMRNVLKYKPPGVWLVKFPYRYVRP